MSRREARISPDSYNDGELYLTTPSPRRTATRITRLDDYDDGLRVTSRSSGGSYTIKRTKSTTFLPGNVINVNGESYGDHPNYQQAFPTEYTYGPRAAVNTTQRPRRVYRIEVEDQYPDSYSSPNSSPRGVTRNTRRYVPPAPKNQLYERILKKKVILKPNHRIEIDEPVMKEKPSPNRPVVRGGVVVYK
jgi:hypothetical protein